MDRAGLRSGDVVLTSHTGGFADSHWALVEANAGRKACLDVSSAADRLAGRYTTREVCLEK
jgi:hypothetical protein